MLKFHCDRCGAEVQRERVCALKLGRNAFCPGVNTQYIQFELCEDCAQEVMSVIGEVQRAMPEKEEPEAPDILPRHLLLARRRAGLSQRELEKRCRIPVKTLSQWENGTEKPGPVDRGRLLAALPALKEIAKDCTPYCPWRDCKRNGGCHFDPGVAEDL